MRLPYSALLLGALALGSAGCGDEPAPPVKTPDVADVFPQIIVPPRAEFLGRAGSEDALQLTFRSAEAPAQVATYYRAQLVREPWQLVGDTPGEDGAATLYAERARVPLWIRIHRDSVGGGSMVEMTGALLSRPDTGTTAASGGDTAAADTIGLVGGDSAAAPRTRGDTLVNPASAR